MRWLFFTRHWLWTCWMEGSNHFSYHFLFSRTIFVFFSYHFVQVLLVPLFFLGPLFIFLGPLFFLVPLFFSLSQYCLVLRAIVDRSALLIEHFENIVRWFGHSAGYPSIEFAALTFTYISTHKLDSNIWSEMHCISNELVDQNNTVTLIEYFICNTFVYV